MIGKKPGNSPVCERRASGAIWIFTWEVEVTCSLKWWRYRGFYLVKLVLECLCSARWVVKTAAPGKLVMATSSTSSRFLVAVTYEHALVRIVEVWVCSGIFWLLFRGQGSTQKLPSETMTLSGLSAESWQETAGEIRFRDKLARLMLSTVLRV